jgi:hypothetical protein
LVQGVSMSLGKCNAWTELLRVVISKTVGIRMIMLVLGGHRMKQRRATA